MVLSVWPLKLTGELNSKTQRNNLYLCASASYASLR